MLGTPSPHAISLLQQESSIDLPDLVPSLGGGEVVPKGGLVVPRSILLPCRAIAFGDGVPSIGHTLKVTQGVGARLLHSHGVFAMHFGHNGTSSIEHPKLVLGLEMALGCGAGEILDGDLVI